MHAANAAAESVLVVRGLGVQCSTTYAAGGTKSMFIECDRIRDVLILEAPRRLQFVFYLAVRHHDAHAPLTVLFPVRGCGSATLIGQHFLPPLARLCEVRTLVKENLCP